MASNSARCWANCCAAWSAIRSPLCHWSVSSWPASHVAGYTRAAPWPEVLYTKRADSDIDLGLYYNADYPLNIQQVRNIANEFNDLPDPVVTDLGGWGRWVNGGAWLTIQGQRVDFLYRNIDFVSSVIDACNRGLPLVGTESRNSYIGRKSLCGSGPLRNMGVARPGSWRTHVPSSPRLASFPSHARLFPSHKGFTG